MYSNCIKAHQGVVLALGRVSIVLHMAPHRFFPVIPFDLSEQAGICLFTDRSVQCESSVGVC